MQDANNKLKPEIQPANVFFYRKKPINSANDIIGKSN